jgi:glycosyltransferase involved in cell wall biosynthesis
VIAPYLGKPWITLIRHPQNRGLSAAVESGLSQITTDFVYFAAADDYVGPNFFDQAMAAAALHPDVGMIFGRLQNFYEGFINYHSELSLEGQSRRLSPEQFVEQYFKVFGGFTNLSPATLYRVEVLKHFDYLSIIKNVDFIYDSFVIQLIGGAFPSYYIDEVGAFWCDSSNGGSHSFFSNPERIRKFVNQVTGYFRHEPYVSALSVEHQGLYIYSLWRSVLLANGFLS